MTEADLLAVIKHTLTVFGGVTVVLVAMISWLGVLWQKRILQREQAAFMNKLEEVRQEHSLQKSSYDHYLGLILEYYDTFYQHYRLCQRAAEADGHRQPDGSITHTKDDFDEGLDSFLNAWAAQERRVRLLPSSILEVHEEAISAFNEMKDAVLSFKKTDETRKAKESAFEGVHTVKVRMESLLRNLLRTENLLK